MSNKLVSVKYQKMQLDTLCPSLATNNCKNAVVQSENIKIHNKQCKKIILSESMNFDKLLNPSVGACMARP